MTEHRIATNGDAYIIQFKLLWFWIKAGSEYYELGIAEHYLKLYTNRPKKQKGPWRPI